MPAMVRAWVAVAPDSLKPACLASATSCWAVPMARHSAARMKGSNRKMSLAPATPSAAAQACSCGLKFGEASLLRHRRA